MTHRRQKLKCPGAGCVTRECMNGQGEAMGSAEPAAKWGPPRHTADTSVPLTARLWTRMALGLRVCNHSDTQVTKEKINLKRGVSDHHEEF